MKRINKVFLGVATAGIVLVGSGVGLLRYSLRSTDKGVSQFLERIKEAARPLTEADAILRYEADHSQFSIHRMGKDAPEVTVPEEELAQYLPREIAVQPKLIVMYRKEDFSDQAARKDFEARLRTNLQAVGATSVVFAVVESDGTKTLLGGLDVRRK